MLSDRPFTNFANSHMRYRSTPCGIRAVVFATVVCSLTLGCATTNNTASTAASDAGRLSPVLRRMQEHYADLQSGRFVTIADFESPAQVGLFELVAPDDVAVAQQPEISVRRSRDETGAGSLLVQLPQPEYTLALDGRLSTDLALIRDWTAYPLLLMSIFGPPEGVLLELSVSSGTATPLTWTRTLPVRPGWNLFRLDVATIGDWIDLRDVRRLTWSAPHAEQPVSFYLDDLILTDNTEHVLGENAAAGELFVSTRGRRMHVGVRGQFELAFADGQIVAWRAGSNENLADIGGLGPWPVPLPADWATMRETPVIYDDPVHFAHWGSLATTNQQIEEATPFRVVISGQWRLGRFRSEPSGGARPASDIGHNWQYVLDSKGVLRVRTRTDAPVGGWSEPFVGYALGLSGRVSFRFIAPPPADPLRPLQPYIHLARAGRTRADLVWTWPAENSLPRNRLLESVNQRRLAALAGELSAQQHLESVHLLRIWPPDLDQAPEAASVAADLQRPGVCHPSAGRVLHDVAGDLDQDGFNETQGVHELALAGGVLRVNYDPGQTLRFYPAFRVHETRGRRCWVYARGRPVTTTGRDADGNLLFRLGLVSGDPVRIEVHTAPDSD